MEKIRDGKSIFKVGFAYLLADYKHLQTEVFALKWSPMIPNVFLQRGWAPKKDLQTDRDHERKTTNQATVKHQTRRKFRSETSHNMDRWKAQPGRSLGMEKVRREKIRDGEDQRWKKYIQGWFRLLAGRLQTSTNWGVRFKVVTNDSQCVPTKRMGAQERSTNWPGPWEKNNKPSHCQTPNPKEV